MKETKVYVDELPKSCVGCKYFAEHRRQCNLELCLQWNEVKFKFDDCPLIDIKTHDRELVKEVCEKIEDWCNKNFNWVGNGIGYDGQDYNEMIGSNNTINKLRGFLNQIQKEYEK